LAVGGEAADDQPPVPLPGWIADLLDPPRSAAVQSTRAEARPGDLVAARLDGLIAAVLDAMPGERNNVLHWAACRAAEMVSAGQLTADQEYDSLGRAAACVSCGGCFPVACPGLSVVSGRLRPAPRGRRGPVRGVRQGREAVPAARLYRGGPSRG